MAIAKSPRLTVITGATAGIGAATARILAKNGSDLILTGRRKDRLKDIKKSIESEHNERASGGGRGGLHKVNVEIFDFDVSKYKECEQVVQENKDLFSNVDALVNNAGLARGMDLIQDGDVKDWDEMIDTNVKGLLYMTRLIIPFMLKNKKGHIVNLGSAAGRWVYPKGNVYAATKFAVTALTESLRMDLLGSPIRVTNVAPGMVETEFSIHRLKDEERAKSVYKGMTPLTAEDIAETIYWCMERPAHMNIQEIVIYPTDQASTQNVHRR